MHINNKKIKPIKYYCIQNRDSSENNYTFTIIKSSKAQNNNYYYD